MDITFACESCGQHIVIDEAGSGLQVICPTCGLGITVPKPRPVGCPNLPPPPRQVPSHSSAGEADLPSVTHLLESFIPGVPSRFRLDFMGRSSEYEVSAEQPMEAYQDDVEALNFHGWFRDSLSGDYSVAWGTRNPTGGYDTEYLLLHQGSILAQGKRTNIQDAVVADNGTFLIHDCGASLQNVVTLFDIGGRKLKQVRPHSTGLLTFDVRQQTAGMEIRAFRDGCRLSGRITFNLMDGNVEVVKPNQPVPPAEPRNAYQCFDRATGEMAGKQSPLRKEVAERVLSLCNRAFEFGFAEKYHYAISRTHWMRGEALESLGQKEEALREYELAVQQDPKVGLKKRIASLRKECGKE